MFSNDAEDILGGEAGSSQMAARRQPKVPDLNLTKVDKKQPPKKPDHIRRPQGMHRELFNLYVHQGKDNNKEKIESLIPTNTKRGYSVVKAQLTKRPVRKWTWRAFTNEAREDGLQLEHWEREDKVGQPYSFARFNKSLEPVTFTAEEYDEFLSDPQWSKEETQHLLEVCQRFDLRWQIVADRFDQDRFGKKSMEDMKERYYGVVNELNAARGRTGEPFLAFDADHERRRKEQLEKLWNRTEEQIKEEEELKEAVKRIETKRKDRERKAHDLQRLISAAERVSVSPDSSVSGTPSYAGVGRPHRRSLIRKGGQSVLASQIPSEPHFRWPEFKQPGPHLRSQEMKLPSNTAQRKLSNIGQVVTALKIGENQFLVSIGLEYPFGTEDMVRLYNDFRTNIVLLQELKSAVHNFEQELDQLAHRFRVDKNTEIPIEPRLRVSETFYDELESNPRALLDQSEQAAANEEEEAKGKGGGKGKGKQQLLSPKLAPITTRRITRMIEVNPVGSVAQTRKRRSQATEVGGGGTPTSRGAIAIKEERQ